MSQSLQTIPLVNLSLAFLPVAITIIVLFKWSLSWGNALYAVSRMLVQLLLIGYFLHYIFKSDSALIVLLILCVMVISSSWIALGTVAYRRMKLMRFAFTSIAFGGGLTLLLITQGVMMLDPWYSPQSMIPIAGMIFANAMNSVSLAAERLNSELNLDVPYDDARKVALQSSLIPVINSLFAVGLVSLPGMMTGQILAGVSPLIAVRYQVMVMCMIFGASGLASATFLAMIRHRFDTTGEKR